MISCVVNAASARAMGISKSRLHTELRTGRWTTIAPQVYLTRPGPPRRSDWVSAGLLLGSETAVLSGWDAARYFGIGGQRPMHSRVLVLTQSGENRIVGGVQLRRSARPIRSWVTSALDEAHPCIRVSSAERAVADAALLSGSAAQVRALVTAAVQRGVCTPDRLIDELAAGPRKGSALLRRALDDVARGARSVAEAEAIDLLRAVRIAPFEVNAPITDRAGNRIAVVDLLWRDLRYVIEIDSREFHFSERDWKQTMARHATLTRLGFAVEHHAPSVVRAGGLRWAREVAGALELRRRELGCAGDQRS